MRHLKAFVCGTLGLWLCLVSGVFSAEGDPPAPAEENPGRVTVHLVGNAHVDLAWHWLWEETVHEVYEHTFGPVLTKLNQFPGLTYAQSQAALYEAVEKLRPQFINQVKRQMKAGRWFPVGGTWAESDLNMPCGESLVRQFLYGQTYFKRKLGKVPEIAWNPDTFGQNWAMPQIMTQAGMTCNIFLRCAPEGMDLFWWEGLDGSRILCYVPPVWYTTGIDEGVRDRLLAAAKKTGRRELMMLHGAGDHGGGPRLTDLQALETLRGDPLSPKFVFSNPEAFVQKIKASTADIPVHKGELNFIFPGCYTSQVETKKNNRRGEALLLTAERFASLAHEERFRHYFPERDLDEAWKIILRNQFHDILPGSSIGPVYDEAADSYREAFRRARRALDFSLETIINAADTSGPGTPLVVFNPLCWPRSGGVEATLRFPVRAGNIAILDSAGTPLPFQMQDTRVEDGAWLYRGILQTGEIPSLGYEIYRVVSLEETGYVRPAADLDSLTVKEDLLENEHLIVRLDEKTGWITSLYDKRQGKEMLSGPGNILQAVTDKPQGMSAWALGPEERIWLVGEEGAEIRVIEKGPVRGVVRVTSRFRRSLFRQDLILYHDSPQLDVVIRMDWHERNLLIKAAFPLALIGGKAFFDIPFGAIQRPADGREVPALRWIDLSADNGMSLINDSRYGFDIKGNRMRISLVRGATFPDPQADEGRHETAYALLPHAGDWREAGTVRLAREFNSPLITRQAMVHGGSLPARHSFLRIMPENIVVTALKKPKGIGTNGLIIRAYEAFGRKTEAELRLPWPAIIRTSDIREPFGPVIGNGVDRIKIPFKPYEIVTIHVKKTEKQGDPTGPIN